MFEMTGRLLSCDRDKNVNKPRVVFAVNERNTLGRCWDELVGYEKIVVKVGPYRRKRSKDANAYFWQLCGELAKKLGTTKEVVYRQMIIDVGTYETIIAEEHAAERIAERWRNNGIGWLVEKADNAGMRGYLVLNLYFGSSTYDTAEMSRLIDNVVAECKEQGIPTETPDEIANMLSLWDKYKK